MQETLERDELFNETRKFTRRFKYEDRTIDVSDLSSTEQTIQQLTEKSPNKYEVTGVIAYGGSKLISRLHDKDTHREVAQATLLNPDADTLSLGKFIREARITANLQHPNIIPIYDIGVEQNHPYFTMKLIDGETLLDITEHLKHEHPNYVSQYKLYDLLRIYHQVLNAIIYAHSHGVIHLDLSPGNIVVGKYGEVLVLDWGLAKVIHKDGDTQNRIDMDADEKVNDIMMQGTPGFMAPEQAQSNITQFGERTDVYALGAILYNILTYALPIEGRNLTEIIERTISGDIPEARILKGPSVPIALSAVAQKAMSVNINERYDSVLSLRNDIDAYLDGRATTAQKASYATHLWLFIKRNFLVVSLILLIAILLGAYTMHTLFYDRWNLGHWGAPVYNFNTTDVNSDWSQFGYADAQNNHLSEHFLLKNNILEIPSKHILWFKTSVPEVDKRLRIQVKGNSPFYILWGCTNAPFPEGDQFPAGTIIGIERDSAWVVASPYTFKNPEFYEQGSVRFASMFDHWEEGYYVSIHEVNNTITIFRNNIAVLSVKNPYPPALGNVQIGLKSTNAPLYLMSAVINDVSADDRLSPFAIPRILLSKVANNDAFRLYLNLARATQNEKNKIFAARCAMNLILFRANNIQDPFTRLDEVTQMLPPTLFPEIEHEFYSVKAEVFWIFGRFAESIRVLKLINDLPLQQRIARRLLNYNFAADATILKEISQIAERETK